MIEWSQVSLETQEVADERIAFLLNESYGATRALLARNRPLLDALTQVSRSCLLTYPRCACAPHRIRCSKLSIIKV